MTLLATMDGTPVSRLAFGTMQFGGSADAAASAEMFRACRDAGINHFDTAHIYTGGASEKILGSLIGSQREALLIATKAGYTGGAGAGNIRAQLDESRCRLGLDCVDLLYLHRFDPETDLAETMDTFAALRSDGAIRYVGLSNFAAWQVMKARALGPVDALQPMYSLIKRQAEVEILPMCTDQGIGVFAYSPLGGGMLTGKYLTGGSGRLSSDDRYVRRYGAGWMSGAAEGLTRIAADLGTAPATLAVAWSMTHPARPCPIVSARSAAQLAPSLAALEFSMDAELYDRIAALSPAPPPATDRTEETG